MAPRTFPRCTWQTTCGYRFAASSSGQRRSATVVTAEFGGLDLRQRKQATAKFNSGCWPNPYRLAIRDAFGDGALHGVIVKTYSVTHLAKDASGCVIASS